MKIKIEKTSRYSEISNVIELDCKGNGTKDDPLIIDESVSLPTSFELNESELYIQMKNCMLLKLKISISKNILIEDCHIDWFELSGCSKIEIVNVISGLIGMGMSNNCILNGCTIERELSIANSSYNLIKNCIVKKRLDYNLFERCIDTTFENNKIPERYIGKIRTAAIKDKNTEKKHQIFTIVESAEEIECTGTGFKEEPFVFTPQKFWHHALYLLETVHYVLINDFNLRYIFLGRCKNKFIKNCDVRTIEMEHCSNIRIERTNLKYLRCGPCENVIVTDCTIDKIEIYKSFRGGVIIKNCSVRQVGKRADRLNLENTEVQKQ
ncbi:MAG: hypothetical protein ACFFBI_09150 [Promethearchaeota archaeon]